MGIGNSSPKIHEGSTEIKQHMTVAELLCVMSTKAGDLKETITNMQTSKMSDDVAIPFIGFLLQTAEEELADLKSSIYIHEMHQKYKFKTPSQQLGSEINPHSFPRHGNKDEPPRSTLDSSRKELAELQSKVSEFTEQKNIDSRAIDDLSKRNEAYKKEQQQLQNDKEAMKEEIQKLKTEKRDLLQRLSKLTGDKLTLDNPNITDLSDPNRPTKLVEMMAELYDNEWTDAFEALHSCRKNSDSTDLDDKKVIKILLDTFMDIFSFCRGKSTGLVSIAERSVNHLFEDFNTTVKAKNRITKSRSTTVFVPSNGKSNLGRENSVENSDLVFMDWQDVGKESGLEDSGAFSNVGDVGDVWPKLEGELKKLRKEFGIALIPMVTKAYLKPRWTKTCVPAMKPYIKKCVHVAWLMCIQTPPMSVASLPQHGEEFDSNIYTAYKTRSTAIDYVVWPAVILTEPKTATEKPTVMNKGVAEGQLK